MKNVSSGEISSKKLRHSKDASSDDSSISNNSESSGGFEDIDCKVSPAKVTRSNNEISSPCKTPEEAMIREYEAKKHQKIC